MKGIFIGLAASMGLIGSAQAFTFSADTATASSVFSSSYAAANTINGSGMPDPFGIADAHAIYVPGNHWTTRANQTIGEHITWGFDDPVTLGSLYIWNHLSTAGGGGVAANPHYAPTIFDLEIFDPTDALIGSLTGGTLQHDVSTAQAIDLGAIYNNVGSVKFTIKETRAEVVGYTFTRYSGLAEVLFSSESVTVVPLPAAGWLFLTGLFALAAVGRRSATT